MLSGTSPSDLVAGDLTVFVGRSELFTATLNLAGVHVPVVGNFKNSGVFSTTVGNGLGTRISVSLAFSGTASLTGTISDPVETVYYTGNPISDVGPASGHYRFIINPGQAFTTGSTPQGTGYGQMFVGTGGVVSIVGRLPDGTGFATKSAITSGSALPIYSHQGGSPNTGVEGTVVFQDNPDVSDFTGTLYWTKLPNADPSYPEGFEMATQLVGSEYNRVIGGLNGDVVTVTLSGADLQKPITAKITLAPNGPWDQGDAQQVHLTLVRTQNKFFGSFADPVTHLRHPFFGVLLAKSRTGGGMFFSQGLSGAISLQY